MYNDPFTPYMDALNALRSTVDSARLRAWQLRGHTEATHCEAINARRCRLRDMIRPEAIRMITDLQNSLDELEIVKKKLLKHDQLEKL